ncbi:histidine triad nucleotide-binding protein [Azospirillum sp. RWY-5-1]|uniref:Histidine triad nucleotide-binding protein n=1 Tax=Azospirillum oleiclasticum TaxID=2735135 RepID=A0ABX2TB52_9PROT|nr:histidine triad nucleotide-binding protein [Azospirillum oleiclasticum]NYZ13073.1 histidine triad nucleotide-binding protein [Azospirillum oleiclasticum]NYZ20254.1 histidine triad nucleotide-binding protein [Azospirillum oleiclasticum]
MTQPYDPNNVFARILRGEIPCRKVLETEHSLAFHDIGPQAPTHILIIPKGAYIGMDDFTTKASDAEVADFFRAVGEVARMAELVETGYRVLSNCGRNAHQEVQHLHYHVVGGRDLGRMLGKPRD